MVKLNDGARAVRCCCGENDEFAVGTASRFTDLLMFCDSWIE